MSLAFSSDDSEPISRKIDDQDNEEKRDESISLENMYEIERCKDWVEKNCYTKIALQFPDGMLCDAAAVALKLAALTNQQYFILGDTSYGSCCVDTVAAEHVKTDAIIHFGHACLSPCERLPVLYIFGKQVIDIQDAISKFVELYPDKKSNIILIYEVMLSYVIGTVHENLKEYENLIISELEIFSENKESVTHAEKNDNLKILTKCHRQIKLPPGNNIENYSIFYIGSRMVTLTNFMLSLKNCRFYSYNPSKKLARMETLDVNKHLKRRYYYIEKAKDANRIGILAGTLGVSNYLTIMNHLKDLIKQSGKKSYKIVVGKLNNAKLANFQEIEVFVNVACVESSLIESREFYQSIITPYELEIALNQAREWTGDYITDFSDILPGAVNYVPITRLKEEESDVSLITGKIRHTGLAIDEMNENSLETCLVTRNDMTISSMHSRAAGEYLTQRTWQGLEQRLGETPVAVVEQGQKGIACVYENEKKQDT